MRRRGHRILDAAGGPSQTGEMGFYEEQILPRVTDRALRSNEAARLRARVTAGLSGEVLEVGFGSGLNMPLLPVCRAARASGRSFGRGAQAGGGKGGGEHGAGGVHRRGRPGAAA